MRNFDFGLDVSSKRMRDH